ncbi:related to MMS21 - SUMO ligase and component of the SMC5-SMC6 complex [Ustilago trichophora]|uniref:Related to MMS21 - SUMO ligase and component of the SMC5-SMC6 complex n=1 Tax=Ustilago trichophora TaxID=86804 RepID=A0A5C3DWE6_9BASI|nr:related to MMS21 - SUMO ligase and component of the SMC5-SMC6 complex [Ustilago trichophora]
MPSASRRNRVADSDEEEDHVVAPPSQRRSQRSNEITSSAGPSRPRNTESMNASSSLLDPAAELRPQPLSREQVPNLRGLMADLKSQDASLLKCIELLNETAEQVAEAFRLQDDCPELDQAELDLRELIDAQAEKAVRRKVLEEIAQDLHTGVQLDDPAGRYKQDVQTNVDAYNKQTSRKKYAKNPDFHNFKNTLWVAKQDGAMPPVRDLIPAEDGDQDDSDDELQMGGATQNFRCPLTTNILEDPITNRSAIQAYVAAGNNRCPASGCQAAVSQRSLKQDPALIKKVAAFKRREEERLIARRQTSTVLY